MRNKLAIAAVIVFAAIGSTTSALAQQGGHGAHSGHASPMEIRPSITDGAVLTTRPDRVEFTFSPAMRLITARLQTAAGETIPVRFDASAASATSVTVGFAPLPPDSYTLSYIADMGDHTMPGRIQFTVR